MNFYLINDNYNEVVKLIRNAFEIDNNSFCELLSNQRFLTLKVNGNLIGALLISLENDPIKDVKGFYIDYVCIDDKYRNKGYGRMMLEEVIRIAKEENVNYMRLTSSSKRVFARKMYNSIGMKSLDTDLFYIEVR
ncbi:MAG: GNAT family N-acetyltransferase [Bacilli bacterium]|nr:GNAT family N-acetyltransferase [Bacilli bacterium]